MNVQTLPYLVLTAAAIGAGAWYYSREAQADEGEDTGLASNFVTAATGAEYEQAIAKLQTIQKPLVIITFKTGQIPFEAMQSAAIAAAREYPQIWVVMLTQGAAEAGGKEGVAGHCGPNDGGVILATPYAADPVYEVCWPKNADPDMVRQNINLAAVNAKNLAAQDGIAVTGPSSNPMHAAHAHTMALAGLR